MEPNNQSAPMNTGQPVRPDQSEHKKVGPIVATLIIVLILIIAALYLFASRVNRETIPADTASENTEVQQVTNTSDDVSSLEADLNASVEGLDSQNF